MAMAGRIFKTLVRLMPAIFNPTARVMIPPQALKLASMVSVTRGEYVGSSSKQKDAHGKLRNCDKAYQIACGGSEDNGCKEIHDSLGIEDGMVAGHG